MRNIILMLYLFPLLIYSQENNTPFSDKDLDTYVSIYIESKLTTSSIETYILPLLESYKVSYERYGEIIKSKIEGKQVTLTKNESRLMAEFPKIEREIKNIKISRLKNVCSSYGFPFELFLKIESYANQNFSFQQQLNLHFAKNAANYEK